MKGFFKFIASPGGRILRIVAGLVVLYLGLSNGNQILSYMFILVGLVLVAVGIFDWCLFAPLAGFPFNGKDLRKKLKV